MQRYEVYEHITNKRISCVIAENYADAWHIAESNGWYPNKYYIL